MKRNKLERKEIDTIIRDNQNKIASLNLRIFALKRQNEELERQKRGLN